MVWELQQNKTSDKEIYETLTKSKDIRDIQE
jgi:hypothetical protein